MASDGQLAQQLRPGGELNPQSNAVVVSSDRPTRLENALEAFQNVLTIDERKSLRREMKVSCDASQVIAFTAGLDVVDPNRRGRSIATKLHSILETVQRFSEVVGIYVSSHPEIAALVWGSVRLAFTVLANFTSFFQTFSELLNGFDTLTPQFKEYQVLFPDSLPLRNSIYDFHSAIISCCTQVVSSTRRTWSQQAWASLTSSFESEIRPRIAEIREKAELVKNQAALAKAQDDSRRQASLAAELHRQERERKWNSLLLKLSSYDHGSAFNQARGKIHRGTAEWIFSTSEFQAWYENADSSILNVSGKIGCGKTILAANVVSYLLQTVSQTRSVSYLFVRFDDENSRLADVILRSLIFQTLAGRQVQDSIVELLEKSVYNGFERRSLLSLFVHGISSLEKVFLVIDGLDECGSQEQSALLQALSQLLQMCDSTQSIKILLSARESVTEQVDRELTPTEHLLIGLNHTNADLARYAEEVLEEKQGKGELVIQDQSIMSQITDRLQVGGEGMFLWVFLTIEDICSCPTDDDIRQTLKILPRELSHTLNRAIGRILSSQPSPVINIVQRAFGWVATVRRPLTRWELGEALGVKILQKSSIKGQIINGTERFPGWCENLVQIEAGDETVRFFHHSIKTHLLWMDPNTTDLGIFHIDLRAWDHQVGEICLTYLNFSDFERALTKTEFSPTPNKIHGRRFAMSDEGRGIPVAVRDQAAVNALPHVARLSANRLLRRFLKARNSEESFHVPKSAPKSEDSSDTSKIFSGYPFLLYATNFWFHHTFLFHHSTTMTWRLWQDQVTTLILDDEKSWLNFGQLPPSFYDENSTLNRWRSDESIWDPNTSELNVLKNMRRDSERIMFHKAIIFADFIAHRALLAHVLTTMKVRGHDSLSHDILELLLPARRVFHFPLEYEGYIRSENSHDGLMSLVAEFIAWGGAAWPRIPSLEMQSPCMETCARKPLHALLGKTLSRSGYYRDDAPWLQLLSKIAILMFTKETAEAIETWTKSASPCIHELPIPGCKDIIDFILRIGGPSSFKLARWVLDLHENCTGGHRYTIEDWRRRLQEAVSRSSEVEIEFSLQEANVALAEQRLDCGIDSDLVREILRSENLPHHLRDQAIPIAIPRAKGYRSNRYTHYTLENAITSGIWDVAVALSLRGEKLAGRVSSGWDVDCAKVLDDILCCVSYGATPRCKQQWVAMTHPTLSICAYHIPKAVTAWNQSHRKNGDDGPNLVALLELLKTSGWKTKWFA